jgi:hypothetical protein
LDFLKILRSFEEFIFEAATWLMFYPRTLWRIIWRPLATMDYSDREQGEPDDKRYDDALSPPIALLITIVLINFVGQALHVPQPQDASDIGKTILNSQTNLILFRSLVFSLVPLVAATTLVSRQRQPITRETLRAPFYAQCYLAAPCAAFVSFGLIIFQRPELHYAFGVTAMAAGAAWFLTAQTRWFRKRLGVSPLNAAGTAAWAVVRALAYLAIVLTALVAPITLL